MSYRLSRVRRISWLSKAIACLKSATSITRNTAQENVRQQTETAIRYWTIEGPHSEKDQSVVSLSLLEEPDPARFDSFNATGAKIWPCAGVLCDFLFSKCRKPYESSDPSESCHNQAITRRRRVLELGSGTGVVGLTCAAFGEASKVVLTDRLVPPKLEVTYDMDGSNATLEMIEEFSRLQDEYFKDRNDIDASAALRHTMLTKGLGQNSAGMDDRKQLDLLEANVLRNRHMFEESCEVDVEELDFAIHPTTSSVMTKHGPFDLVIASDITYNRDIHADLAMTLNLICEYHKKAQGLQPKIFLAHQQRRAGQLDHLRQSLSCYDLDFDPVHVCDDIQILRVACLT